MDSNQHTDSMQQRRYNHFEQNHLLMKILVEKCRPLGLPSQQGTKKKRVDSSVKDCCLVMRMMF
jgi:hypothetical protein